MPSYSTLFALAVVVSALSGCSYLKYPDVHKLTIRQGNIINQQMIDQLRPGMTRAQVRYVLGTPLIAHTFDQSRWDYFYSIKQPGREELRERISVYFKDDQLAYFSGDYVPSAVAAALEAKDAASEQSAPGSQKKTAPSVGKSKNKPQTQTVAPSEIIVNEPIFPADE